jgi:hypothetical protein
MGGSFLIMNIRHFSVGRAFARFSVAGASLLAAGAGAQIVGTGFQATYDNLAEVATFVAPDGSTYQITGPNSDVRLTGTGPATLTPQYVRPTHLSTWGQRQWDIEQFVVGTPQGERYVPQFSRGGILGLPVSLPQVLSLRLLRIHFKEMCSLR